MDRLFPPPAVAQAKREPKRLTEVPDATDANATMRYWDEVRRVEREKTALMSRDQKQVYFKNIIGEFPTPELLAQKAQVEADFLWSKLPWWKRSLVRVKNWFKRRLR